MQRYQSHKIVEAARITEFNAVHGGTYSAVFEDGEDQPLIGSIGDRILKMAVEAGTTVNGGWLMYYPDGYISWSPHGVFEEGYDLVQPSSGKSKIAGYRELNEGEVAAINDVKQLGQVIGSFIEIQRGDEQCDQRWVSVGVTHLQQGIMALVRAIAKPDFF